ncbi:MAG: adenylate/guanylate cyclase domain-containing protein [Candidatus Peregrinibacteria bacterium]
MIKKIVQFIGLGLVIVLVTAILMDRGLLMGVQRSLQNKFYDYDQASSEIVVVSIDEKSLKALGPLTRWPREYYAQAIEALETGGAKVIGLDITLPDLGDDDEILAEMLSQYDNVVLSARYYFENGRRKVELPNATLMSVDPTLGWINVNLDEDGFVRQLPSYAKSGDETLEAFSLAVSRLYAGNVDVPVVTKRDGTTGEEVSLMNINYFGAPNAFAQVSFVDVMNKRFVDKQGNRADMKDKVVLIGPTALDLQDHYLSPVSEGVKMAGVEIHANAVQTITEGKFLHDQSRRVFWITMLGILVVNLVLFSFLKLRYATPVVVIELIGIAVAGVISYEVQVLVNVVYPAFTALATFVGAYLLRFLIEQKKRRFIQGAFGHYVSPEVVKQILAHPETLQLGGAKRDITTFFSDIAGFTSISEKMEPTELVTFLNEYLQAMTEVILKHQGTLDKYEGDAIMAFWNAPVAQHDHAKSACLAALEQQARLQELRKQWKKAGLPEIHARMGINTGPAVVGNMGSADRFDYTAIGDAVNLASRLEGINKQYGTEIIISENTYAQVRDLFECRQLDRTQVKGKEQVVTIYELIKKI